MTKRLFSETDKSCALCLLGVTSPGVAPYKSSQHEGGYFYDSPWDKVLLFPLPVELQPYARSNTCLYCHFVWHFHSLPWTRFYDADKDSPHRFLGFSNFRQRDLRVQTNAWTRILQMDSRLRYASECNKEEGYHRACAMSEVGKRNSAWSRYCRNEAACLAWKKMPQASLLLCLLQSIVQ